MTIIHTLMYLGSMKIILIVLFVTLMSCARGPLVNKEDNSRLTSNLPVLKDTLSKESFFSTLRSHILVMRASGIVHDPMVFGHRKISKATYLAALERILSYEDSNDWLKRINDEFDFFEIYGKDNWSEVLVTGYYEPQVKGSRKKDVVYSQALYSTPSDLITIDLKNFAYKFPKGSKLSVMQGRLVNQNLMPYFSRAQIDVENGPVSDRYALAWVEPVDAFFIQIQGSGTVIFENGEKMRVGYDTQNGFGYTPIGKFLTDYIPMEEMSMQRIRSHLKTLSPSEQQQIMNRNASYVFFKTLTGPALTYGGMEVSDGRTIATDYHFYSKGALAFLDIEEPIFENEESTTPVSWQHAPRLVFDQDTGGAIKGGGRVDLFFGSDSSSAQKAGVMKRVGKLYYLVPKETSVF